MKRTRIPSLIAAALATVALASSAAATVDSYLPYRYVYTDLQTGDYCLARHLMWAEIGIPAGSLMEASAQPVMVYRQGPAAGQVDVNELSTGLEPAYVSDSIDASGVWNYAMRLDVSDLAAQNGTTQAGRRATVEAAKLYLIAMAENMQFLSPDAWRLSITFVGLPAQSDLPGTPLYAKTSWPYTTGSGLLAAYRAELLDQHGACRPL